MQPHLPEHLGLRRAIDRSGRAVTWERCLREPSVSTADLLFMLCCRSVHGLVHDGSRLAAREALSIFLLRAPGEGDFELSVDMDRGNTFYLGKLPAGPTSAAVLVQGMRIWLAQLVDATPEEYQSEISALFEDLCAREGVPLETLPLIVLLTAPEMHTTFSWLYGRLICDIAIAIESSIQWDSLGKSPVDGIGELARVGTSSLSIM